MTQSRSMRRGRRSTRARGRNKKYRTRGSFALAKKSYVRRLKGSKCRGVKRRTCRAKPGCIYASGRKRKFCRKSRSSSR